MWFNAAFRLACRSQHYCFDGYTCICTTAQVPLATEGRPSGKHCLTNKLITLSFCPVADISDKAKAVWLLRAITLKWQAVITWCSGKAASGKLVWNQHCGSFTRWQKLHQCNGAKNWVHVQQGMEKSTADTEDAYSIHAYTVYMSFHVGFTKYLLCCLL